MTTTQTSLTEQNRAVVQAFYDAIIAGDTDGFVAVSAEDMIVHQPSFLPYGKSYHGRDTFVGLFDSFAKYYDLTKIRCDYLVADGERVFGVIRVPVLANGKDVLFAEQVVVRDGLVAELRIFIHEAQTMVQRS